MLRKLAIAIAASGAMMSAGQLHALGMGEIELESALNQPLDARIKLLKASELENWEIKPDLASPEAFDKSGVERTFFLNNFKFEVERVGSDVFVNISTQQPVVEPFLNFLVRVDWPNGRLLREYTLLLDPPVFTEETPAPVQAPQDQYVAPQPETLPGMTPSPTAYEAPVMMEPEPQMQPAPVVEKAPKPKKQQTYKVRTNDTLWEVAQRTRPNPRITPQQAMLAIQDLNPDAFIGGNINRLKKNQVLRIPTEDQILSRNFNEAVSEVAMQNRVLAESKAKKAQLDATRKDTINERDDQVSESRLKLLAGGEATGDMERSASGQVVEETGGDQSKLEQELSLAAENLDKSQRDNQELRTRLDTLEEQINTLQRLINLKDQQMVALQSGMSEKEVQEEMAKAPTPQSETMEMVEAEVAPELIADPAEQTSMPAESGDVMVKDPEQDLNFASDGGQKAPKQPESEKKTIAPAPMPVDEPFDPVAFALENPPVIGGALAALLLALLGVNYARKKKESAELQEGGDIVGNGLVEGDPLADADLDLDANLDDEFADLGVEESAVDGGLGSSIEDGSEGSSDVIAEADGYIAYGRTEAARDVLLEAVQSQPGRADVRVKLVETLAMLSATDQLQEHVAFVMENGDEQQQAAVQAYASGDEFAGSDLMTDGFDELDLGDGDESLDLGGDSLDLGDDLAAGEFDASDLEDGELDFDLDGLDLDAGGDAPEASADGDFDSDLEFDLDLDDAAPMAEADDLDVGIDSLEDDGNSLDFELGEDSVVDVSEDISLEDDGLSLDLDSDDSGLEFDLDEGELDTGDLESELSLDEGLAEISADDNSLDFDMGSDDALELDSDTSLELDGEDELSLDDLGGDAELDLGELDTGEVEFDTGDLELDAGDSELELSSLEEVSSEDVSLDLGDDAELSLELDSALEIDGDELEVGDLEGLELDTGDDLDLGGDELPELDTEDALTLEVDDELPSLDEVQDLTDQELAEDAELASLDTDLEDMDMDLSEPDSLEASDDTVEISLSEGDELPTLEEFEVSSDSEEVAEAPGLGDLPELSDDDSELDLETDLDFLSGTDESETKLDLARAYIDMDDKDGAREILQEVLEEGSDAQKQEANNLMDGMA